MNVYLPNAYSPSVPRYRYAEGDIATRLFKMYHELTK